MVCSSREGGSTTCATVPVSPSCLPHNPSTRKALYRDHRASGYLFERHRISGYCYFSNTESKCCTSSTATHIPAPSPSLSPTRPHADFALILALVRLPCSHRVLLGNSLIIGSKPRINHHRPVSNDLLPRTCADELFPPPSARAPTHNRATRAAVPETHRYPVTHAQIQLHLHRRRQEESHHTRLSKGTTCQQKSFFSRGPF